MKKQKLFQQILMKGKQPVKINIFTCIFLITVALLRVVSVYSSLIKYQPKQKHLLPFDDINNKQKFYINKCIIKRESAEKLKDIDIENHTCYYIDDIIKIEEFDLCNILIDKKSYKNILVYNISY